MLLNFCHSRSHCAMLLNFISGGGGCRRRGQSRPSPWFRRSRGGGAIWSPKGQCSNKFGIENSYSKLQLSFSLLSLRSRRPCRLPPRPHPHCTPPLYKILEFLRRPALPGPRWLAIPLFNNNIIRSRCEGIKLANGLRHPAKSAGSEAGSGGFRVQCWNQKMSVAAALLHFRRGFRRGFRRVPLGSGHANAQMG